MDLNILILYTDLILQTESKVAVST